MGVMTGLISTVRGNYGGIRITGLASPEPNTTICKSSPICGAFARPAPLAACMVSSKLEKQMQRIRIKFSHRLGKPQQTGITHLQNGTYSHISIQRAATTGHRTVQSSKA